MAQIREIKGRITSVKKTKKITQAMKMVAAAKFKRATQRVLRARDYYEEYSALLQTVVSSLEEGAHIPFMQASASSVEVVVIVTGDRGLCGGFNNSIIKYAENYIEKSTSDIQLICVGNKGASHFKSHYPDRIRSLHSHMSDDFGVEAVSALFSDLKDDFVKGKIGKVTVIYNEFKSALVSLITRKQLLPFLPTDSAEKVKDDYFFEPDKEALVQGLIDDFVDFNIYTSFIESQAGEEGARMAAMDAATDNAAEMIHNLTLIYNRTRQAQITTELSEIVAGAEAQVQ